MKLTFNVFFKTMYAPLAILCPNYNCECKFFIIWFQLILLNSLNFLSGMAAAENFYFRVWKLKLSFLGKF